LLSPAVRKERSEKKKSAKRQLRSRGEGSAKRIELRIGKILKSLKYAPELVQEREGKVG